MKYLIWTLIFVFLSFESHASLKVVTTFSVIEDLVKNVASDKVEIFNLVPAGEDPHLFEPTPTDIEKVKQADIVFTNGLMFEPWVYKLVRISKTKAKVVVLTQNIKPRSFEIRGQKVSDPHAWNSPVEILKYVDALQESLSQEQAQDAGFFKSNSALFKKKIKAIDDKYRMLISKVPKEKRVVLTTHDAGFYLCDNYEIRSISPLGLSTSEEFKTSDLSKLLVNIKKYNIKIIFSEKSHHQLLSKKLANKAQLTLGKPLFLDGLSTKAEGAATVLEMFEYNLDQILHAID